MTRTITLSLTPTLEPQPPTSGPWSDWVVSMDELSRSMRDRLVFWNFREGPLEFPPSYRWRRGAYLGDYTGRDTPLTTG